MGLFRFLGHWALFASIFNLFSAKNDYRHNRYADHYRYYDRDDDYEDRIDELENRLDWHESDIDDIDDRYDYDEYYRDDYHDDYRDDGW